MRSIRFNMKCFRVGGVAGSSMDGAAMNMNLKYMWGGGGVFCNRHMHIYIYAYACPRSRQGSIALDSAHRDGRHLLYQEFGKFTCEQRSHRIIQAGASRGQTQRWRFSIRGDLNITQNTKHILSKTKKTKQSATTLSAIPWLRDTHN